MYKTLLPLFLSLTVSANSFAASATPVNPQFLLNKEEITALKAQLKEQKEAKKLQKQEEQIRKLKAQLQKQV